MSPYRNVLRNSKYTSAKFQLRVKSRARALPRRCARSQIMHAFTSNNHTVCPVHVHTYISMLQMVHVYLQTFQEGTGPTRCCIRRMVKPRTHAYTHTHARTFFSTPNVVLLVGPMYVRLYHQTKLCMTSKLDTDVAVKHTAHKHALLRNEQKLNWKRGMEYNLSN